MHNKLIGPYVITSHKLGEGSTSKVYKGYHHETKDKVAIKVISINFYHKNKSAIDKEIYITGYFFHDNIVKLYDTYISENAIYIILEYCSKGDLFTHIIDNDILPEYEIKRIFIMIINGIKEIHENNISHRDIKLENILINKNDNIKISDFGLSDTFDIMKTLCGTCNYVSPEIIKNEPYDGKKTDIWSLGVILYIMSHKRLPFGDDDDFIIYENILNGKYNINDDLSSNLIDLIDNMLQLNPNNRLNVDEIIYHVWMN